MMQRLPNDKYIYIYIWAGSNENSSFIANVRTAESTPRVPFSLNNTRLCRLNVHALFMMNKTTFSLHDALFRLNVVLFIMNNASTFSLNNFVGSGSRENLKKMENRGLPS